MNAPSKIITLSNGKRVANFSSPHPFRFTDGSKLPAHNSSWAEQYKILFIEKDCGDGDVELSFELTDSVRDLMRLWRAVHILGEVDVVYIPLPMLQAMVAKGINIKSTPFRAVRMESRTEKLLSIHKQTIMGVGLM